MPETGKVGTTWWARLAPWLLIGGLVVFHAVNNWIWLAENVTWTGWDQPRHLAWSLNYAQLLEDLSLNSLFSVMVSDQIRPPLFPASAAVLYKLFGRSADVATMVNVIYMAIALGATYGIGRRWAGRRLGLISAMLLALFPMFYSMSRHFYLEFAVTAMVSLTVCLLLATEGFQRRGISLLFGLSLGLGLLTKRTFAVFLTGPLLVVLLDEGLFTAAWQRLKRRPRVYWKNVLVALVGGLLPALLWYLPNRQAVTGLILGDSLFLCWWGLAALAIYFATLPSTRLSNAAAALFLAAGLASTWYLSRIEFLQRVALYGYGIEDPRGRTLQLGSVNTYLYYLRKLANEHISSLLFVVGMLILLVAAIVHIRRHGSLRQALRKAQPTAWVVLSWVGGAYLLLTLSIYQETRAFTPTLPAVALILGAALLGLPWRRLKVLLLAGLLLFGLLQFFTISYESVHRFVPNGSITLPFWGRTALFAQGNYIQLPDENETDRGYWIEPDVLQRMEEQRLALGRELLSLGLLVNTSQINAGPFNYLILTEYPNLRVESLIDLAEPTSPYSRLFAHEYLAVKRPAPGMNPLQEQVINDILDGPPPLFDQLFELETVYPLPDGESVYLYRQRHYLPADYPGEYVTQLASDLGNRTQTGDALLLTPPQLAGPFLSNYAGPAEVSLVPAAPEELAEIAARHRRIFLILADADAGPRDDGAQEWLNQNAFPAGHEWAGSLQLLVYGTTSQPPATSPAVNVGASLGDRALLVGFDLPIRNWHPGEIVPLTLIWESRADFDQDYRVFVHLVDRHGTVVAQSDSEPMGGSRPTSSWIEGEMIVDRHGVHLPTDLQPGQHELRVGLYLPATGDRLPVTDAGGNLVGDSLGLAPLQVTAP